MVIKRGRYHKFKIIHQKQGDRIREQKKPLDEQIKRLLRIVPVNEGTGTRYTVVNQASN